MKKKSDVKFIIYQSLYIFVVCVIAIKGCEPRSYPGYSR